MQAQQGNSPMGGNGHFRKGGNSPPTSKMGPYPGARFQGSHGMAGGPNMDLQAKYRGGGQSQGQSDSYNWFELSRAAQATDASKVEQLAMANLAKH